MHELQSGQVSSRKRARTLRRALRDFAQRHSSVCNPLWKLYFPLVSPNEYFSSVPEATPVDVFREIYQSNGWNSEESRSGPGSTLLATANVRRKLPKLLKYLQVRTFLDAPCGDFHWMRTVDLSGIEYIGGDIVPEIIAELKSTNSGRNMRFVTLDIVQDAIPTCDLWLCRDVLFHLPEADVVKVLRKAARSEVGYLLTSSHPFEKRNRDVSVGGFRHINLREAPYNLPKPLATIEDFVIPYAPRVLWLWSRDQLQAAL